jgi:phosphoribosylformimino-5-aminoimidazole carboxamide ribotide isomerase
VLLVPAIDLLGGGCVRLLRGSFSEATRYAADPVETARAFDALGVRWLHVVDLDAAEGRGKDNRQVIARIREAVGCRLEVGGGVRTEEDARALFSLGADRIVLGTVLVRAPREVARWTAALGRRFAGGIDARAGRVKVAGWADDAALADTEAAAGLAALGIRGLVYTSIERDGTLAGPDIGRTNAAARAAGLPTILSGGIGSEADVERAVLQADPLVAGVILGKALYEGRIDLGRLLNRFPQEPLSAWDFPAS